MWNNRLARLWQYMAAVMFLVGCDKSSALSPDVPSAEIRSIASLKTLAQEVAVPIDESIIICGTITANDRYGEVRQRLFIEDASGAISVAVARSNNHIAYPIGSTLSIHCTALTLCNYGGKIELGCGVDAAGYTRPLDEVLEARHLRITSVATSWPKAQPLTFDQLDPSWIDRYVLFERVHFVEGGAWCTLDPTGEPMTTEHTLADEAGGSLTVRTLGTADYAREPLPAGSGRLYGVIDYFGGRYSLRVVNRGFDF